jgi:predicted Holliday junction resolvase-like endonuclease
VLVVVLVVLVVVVVVLVVVVVVVVASTIGFCSLRLCFCERKRKLFETLKLEDLWF